MNTILGTVLHTVHSKKMCKTGNLNLRKSKYRVASLVFGVFRGPKSLCYGKYGTNHQQINKKTAIICVSDYSYLSAVSFVIIEVKILCHYILFLN